jgi:hypothetical protein
MLSETCLNRIYAEKLTTPELIVLYKCNWDNTEVLGEKIHKVDGMLGAVVLDLLSVIVMYVLL